MIIRGTNVIYTIAYHILKPLGLAPASMAFVSGGLFGLLLIPVGTIYALKYIAREYILPEDGIWHDAMVYALCLYVLWYLVTVAVDNSHCRVEDTCFRMPMNFFDDTAYDYFLSIFDYFPMTCVPASDKVKLDPNKQYIVGGES